MLRNIPPLLSPDLLWTLRAMGHGDEIVVADANFPAESTNDNCIRLDGVDASDTLQAILAVMPLDSFVSEPALTMEVVGDPNAVPEAVRDFQRIVDATADAPRPLGKLERHAFYERAKQAFAVVQTGETRLYGNILLTKGVIGS